MISRNTGCVLTRRVKSLFCVVMMMSRPYGINSCQVLDVLFAGLHKLVEENTLWFGTEQNRSWVDVHNLTTFQSPVKGMT